ncbi:MAG: monovalent cation/H(+) antiporter subunit G [Methanocorpusculum sp.]|nr:monovalent cation/H(+) antiporter subunit G [Methanocorpusculum sp.]
MTDIIITILLVLALIFSAIGVLGLFRLPDFYTRIHAAGIVGSLGFLLTGVAVLIWCIQQFMAGSGEYLGSITHIVLALVVVFVTATTSTHAIARSAYRSDNKPKLQLIDALGKDAETMQKQEERRK